MIQASKLINRLEQRELDSVLGDIYGYEAGNLNVQYDRYRKAVSEYINLFGDDEVEIYSAPGRTEVCGNHTDHRHGMILAASINLDAIAVVGKTNDGSIFLPALIPKSHIL